MSVERFPSWGRLDEYDYLCAVLLSRLSNTPPLPDFWSLEKNESKVAIAVCRDTGMSPEHWKQLTLPERLPYLEATIGSYQPTELVPANTDDRDWLKQVEVAKVLDLSTTKVANLCIAGELRTNGESGKAKRIDSNSVGAYAKKMGISATYNDT